MPRLLDRDRSLLVVIDVQEAYRGKTLTHDRMVERVGRLVGGAHLFDIPIIVTEQYPMGIGHTQSEVRELLGADHPVIEKMTMSCMGQAAFVEQLQRFGRRQIVVCGIEAHACVSQTVHDLLAADFAVHLPRDAISARFECDDAVAWQKMIGSGAVPSSSEMVLLEWVRSAEDPRFKQVHRLIK